MASFLNNPDAILAGWEERLARPGGIAAVRSDVRDISRDHSDALIKSLELTKSAQLRAIMVSILGSRTSQLGAREGTALLLRIEPYVGTEMRSVLWNCAAQWTLSMEKEVVLEQIREFRRLAPHLDKEFNLLSLYAGANVNDDPSKVLEVIIAESTASLEQVKEAVRMAATRVTPGRLPAFQESVLQQAVAGTPGMGPALVVAARRMSQADPDGYAPALESWRHRPEIYDHLVMGYIQSVAQVDAESAQTWADTISDPGLRSSAEKFFSTRRR